MRLTIDTYETGGGTWEGKLLFLRGLSCLKLLRPASLRENKKFDRQNVSHDQPESRYRVNAPSWHGSCAPYVVFVTPCQPSVPTQTAENIVNIRNCTFELIRTVRMNRDLLSQGGVAARISSAMLRHHISGRIRCFCRHQSAYGSRR
jgi:hypothetical protein